MAALSPVARKSVGVRLYLAAARLLAAISERFRRFGNHRIVPALSLWPLALIGIVIVKALLSLLLKPGSFLLAHSGIPYFLLLLLAAGLALQNGFQNTLKNRPFWVLLAAACGLWALDQWIFLYYEFVVHANVPDNSIADPLLFLHVSLLIAAVSTLPHRDTLERKLYPQALNSVLVLIFWGFLYFYVVFPYQLFSSSARYALTFDSLYLLENWTLILTIGFLSVSASAPWKQIYLHLLGASTLYALSSALANLAIDSGGYVYGKLYGVGLTAAVCWFVWIPLRARQLAVTERGAAHPEHHQRSPASAWAMLVVVFISIPIVWELLRSDGVTDRRTFRMLVAVAAIVCLASAAFIKEYLAKSELAATLGSAHERLRLAMESANTVGWDWDLNTSHVSWFGDLKTNFGIDSETYVERAADFFQRYVHPLDRERVSTAVTEARRNHTLYHGEFRVLWPDGTLRWVSANGEFQYSADARATHMLGIATDITEKKELQTALRENQDRMVAIVESSDDAIISKDLDGIISTWNRSAEQLFGYSAAEVVGQPITLIIPDELRDEEAYILQCMRSGERIHHCETSRVTKDGRKLRVLLTVSPLTNSSGAIIGASAIVRDISAQKQAEQALRNSEERFRLFMNHSPAVAWMKDRQGRYIYINETYEKHFGVQLRDRLGKTDFEIYPRSIAEQFAKNDQDALTAGYPVEFTEDSIDQQGNPCYWLAYKFPFHDASGQVFVGGIGVDVTERRKAKESLQALAGRLIHAQEEERARISRELHDDFSQRLALLGVGLAQLSKKLPSNGGEREHVSGMLKAIRELSTDLHTLSHELHSSRLEHVGLVSALRGLCKEISEKYRIQVDFAAEELRFPISQDVALTLFRVTQEALGNVVKHSNAGAAEVALVTGANAITLTISDSGIGFNPSVQKPDSGIGIIGMCERLRLVGGQLQLNSSPNSGTQIVAEVPVTTAADTPLPAAQAVGR